MNGSQSIDPIIAKIEKGWDTATHDTNYKKAAKWLRLFVQYTKTPSGVPEEFQPRVGQMVDFLLMVLDDIDDKSTPDVVTAIKFARRQLKTRVAYGSGFSQTLSDEERQRASVIGAPIKLGFQHPVRTNGASDSVDDEFLDNHLDVN